MARALLQSIPGDGLDFSADRMFPVAHPLEAAPLPTASQPLAPNAHDMLAPAEAPGQAPGPFWALAPLNSSQPPSGGSDAAGPALPPYSEAVNTIFIGSWIAILVIIGIVFFAFATTVILRKRRIPPQSPSGVMIPGRSTPTVEEAVIPISAAESNKAETAEPPEVRRVLVELPNDEICCGVELTVQDRAGQHGS